MKTNIISSLLETRQGQEANDILRRCVHCGFCNAVCPTYQLFNDELDGPRGRIYLIKQLLEGASASSVTQTHLDRCLLCRSCETTCPSGVEYGRLAELGKQLVNKQVARSFPDRIRRWLVLKILPQRRLMNILLGWARSIKYLLPTTLRKQVSVASNQLPWPRASHPRKMLLLQGCVQSGMAPDIDTSVARVLNQFGISLETERQVECCGAIEYHLDKPQPALQRIKANIDNCWPHIEAGVEAILMSASGCSLMLKDYAHLLRDDKEYSEKAAMISEKIVDVSEILQQQELSKLNTPTLNKSIAYHSPCTQQHGLKLSDNVKSLLMDVGFRLVPVNNNHMCCGSAGTYSLFNPEISSSLRDRKLMDLQRHKPEIIATANIGCLLHLTAKASIPVVHWIQLLDDTHND